MVKGREGDEGETKYVISYKTKSNKNERPSGLGGG